MAHLPLGEIGITDFLTQWGKEGMMDFFYDCIKELKSKMTSVRGLLCSKGHDIILSEIEE